MDSKSKSSSSELRVGVFVISALGLAFGLLFLLGSSGAIFSSKVQYTTVFEEIDGLRAGSPVRIAGLDVGLVESVDFDSEGKIVVSLLIQEDSIGFLREGSRSRVGSKGLLGDQLVDISVGIGEPLSPGGVIESSRASALTGFLGETGNEAESIVHNLNLATAGFADPQLAEDLRTTAHNLAELSTLAQQDGTLRRLLIDPSLADELTATVHSLHDTSDALNRSLGGVRRIVNEVERGDGTAHEVIYGDAGVELLGSLARAAVQLASLLRDIRSGDNNAHSLLYGEEGGDLIGNLTGVSSDLRAIVADIRAGRGTVGGLLVDPSIYEDIKRLVGNLQRNEILRSLVRYSIRHDGQRVPSDGPQESETSDE